MALLRYSITPLLLKVEELVVGTSSGKSPKLAGGWGPEDKIIILWLRRCCC
jgi:hypothetical protein